MLSERPPITRGYNLENIRFYGCHSVYKTRFIDGHLQYVEFLLQEKLHQIINSPDLKRSSVVGLIHNTISAM